MKALVAGLLGVLVSTTVACGPGLSHRVKAPAQDDVFASMDSELSHAIGTTTLTSAEDDLLPPSRIRIVAPVAAVPTWGAQAESESVTSDSSGAGIAPTIATAPAASNDFDMHPYDALSFDMHPYD